MMPPMGMALFDALRSLAETGEEFLRGVREALRIRAPVLMRGRVASTERVDASAAFKDRLAAAGVYDHELQVRTPANPLLRCVVRHPWLGWTGRVRCRLAAVVAVDLAEVIRRASGGDEDESADWPPVSADALARALAPYRRPHRRSYVGLCSPSGFSDAALEDAHRLAAPLVERGGGLLLISPRPDGGWKLHRTEHDARPWHFLFDPETTDAKIERIRRAIERSPIELADAGLVDRDLADALDVEVGAVRLVFRLASSENRSANLRVRELDGDLVLLGSPGTDFTGIERSGSMFDRLRQLLRLKGAEQKKIEMLGDKQALLSKRRADIYREMDALGERETELKARGVEADSNATRRRIAGELAQVRRRIEQGNTMVGVFNRQIDILSTHIHHLTLVTQGEKVELPDVEEMTRDAVRAEELLERVQADADVVETLAETTGTTLSSRMEDEIMAEFAAAAGESSGEASGEARESAEREPPAAEQAPPATTPPAAEPPAADPPRRDRRLAEEE